MCVCACVCVCVYVCVRVYVHVRLYRFDALSSSVGLGAQWMRHAWLSKSMDAVSIKTGFTQDVSRFAVLVPAEFQVHA